MGARFQWFRQRHVATAIFMIIILFYFIDHRETYGGSIQHLPSKQSNVDTQVGNTLVEDIRFDNTHIEDVPDENIDVSCDITSGLQDIFLVLRTGANEALERLPAHFNTTLRCLSSNDYGIWSDFEEDIGGYHVMNALDELAPEIVESNPDFAYYRRLQEGGRGSFTVEELEGWANAANGPAGRDSPGWKLDKWKFLPMVDKVYRQRHDAKWYVFMEGDTYFNWTNFLHWLSKIDPSKPYYIGKEVQIGDDIFAYGGAGFVISQPAMKALVEYRATKPGVYEELTANHWAGDCILGIAMKDAGVELSWQRPNFFGESPFAMDYSATMRSSEHYAWCYYVSTYHHMTSSDIDEVFRFEKMWKEENSTFLRHRDVFHALMLPKLGYKVENWDNDSSDDEGPMETFEECQSHCSEMSDCLQFVFYEHERLCKTSSTIKTGHRRHESDADVKLAVSGWMMDRVESFIGALDAKCPNDVESWILP
ncbi:hypothetical protein JX266_007773 [Neoarthrinium moseri]|nr:hypothetical protein JX266_007773 [Neoarthrinium moseri]